MAGGSAGYLCSDVNRDVLFSTLCRKLALVVAGFLHFWRFGCSQLIQSFNARSIPCHYACLWRSAMSLRVARGRLLDVPVFNLLFLH